VEGVEYPSPPAQYIPQARDLTAPVPQGDQPDLGGTAIDPEMVGVFRSVFEGIKRLGPGELNDIEFNRLEQTVSATGEPLPALLGAGIGLIINSMKDDEWYFREAQWNELNALATTDPAAVEQQRAGVLAAIIDEFIPVEELGSLAVETFAELGLDTSQLEERGFVPWDDVVSGGGYDEGGGYYGEAYVRRRGDFPELPTPQVPAAVPSMNLLDALNQLTRARGGRNLEIPGSLRRLLAQFGLGDQFAWLLQQLGFQSVGDISAGGVLTDWIVPEVIDSGLAQQLLGQMGTETAMAMSLILDSSLGISGSEQPCTGASTPR
jgi:hypothetical protein